MLVWFKKQNGYVIAYNNTLTKDKELFYYNKNQDTTLIVDCIPDNTESFDNPVLYVDIDTKELKWVDEYKEPTEQPKTQLDLIQEAVEKSNDELCQEGAYALTEELIAMGII